MLIFSVQNGKHYSSQDFFGATDGQKGVHSLKILKSIIIKEALAVINSSE